MNTTTNGTNCNCLRFHFETYVGTEELGHLEMVAAIVHQLTRNLTDEQVKANPNFAAYFVDHTAGVYPTAASGFPWSAASIQSTGDVIADLTEDMAADAAMCQAQHLWFCKQDPAQAAGDRLHGG